MMFSRRFHILAILFTLSIGGHAFGEATLVVSGTAGVAELGRPDLDFNFQNGSPGLDGEPFRVENAYGPQGVVYDGNAAPALSLVNEAISADYQGKFAVSVHWAKAAIGSTVFADVTIDNHLPVPIQGYTLDLLNLRFPTAIAANDGNPNLRAYNTGSPGILIANYGGAQPGSLVCDIEGTDVSQPLLMVLERGNPTDSQATLKVMNHHNYGDGGSPFPYWPVPANGSIHFRIGLRFASVVPDPMAVCPDLFAAFARRYPVMQNVRAWQDRRPIAQVFLASYDTNGGRNPRKWLSSDAHVDVTTPAGVKHFQGLIFQRAHDALKRMKEMNAQGVITWDIEGAEYPASTYMGDPMQIITTDPIQSVAPEIAPILDRYFKIYRDAGYRVGVTIRPQQVMVERDPTGRPSNIWENDANWQWKSDPPADLQTFWQNQLEKKIRYAHDRWGCTLFYIDSNGDPNDPVSFLVMRNLAAEFPDVLLIPEQSTIGYYSACTPFRQLSILPANLIVSPLVRRTYIDAGGRSPCFSVINPTIESMTRCWPELVQEIRAGDILFFRAWYDADELPAIRQAYALSKK
jgi:hypothetical protein